MESLLFGPTHPWLGLAGAAGVALAFVGWLLARNAADRTRAILRAAGALLLLYPVVTALGHLRTTANYVATYPDIGESHLLVDVALALGGVVIGVYAVMAARRALADRDTDDERSLGLVDLAAVTLAIALPVLPPFDPSSDRGDITAAVVVFHVLFGLVTAAALFALGIDDAVAAGVAFAAVAAGMLATVAGPQHFSNEHWSALGGGFAAGLAVAVALPLLAAALRADRDVLVAGSIAALALLVVTTVANGWLSRQYLDSVRTEFDPSQVPIMPVPTFPGFPSSPSQ